MFFFVNELDEKYTNSESSWIRVLTWCSNFRSETQKGPLRVIIASKLIRTESTSPTAPGYQRPEKIPDDHLDDYSFQTIILAAFTDSKQRPATLRKDICRFSRSLDCRHISVTYNVSNPRPQWIISQLQRSHWVSSDSRSASATLRRTPLAKVRFYHQDTSNCLFCLWNRNKLKSQFDCRRLLG